MAWGYTEQFLHVEYEDMLEMYRGMGYIPSYQEPTFIQARILTYNTHKQ